MYIHMFNRQRIATMATLDDVATNCACLRTRMAARKITRAYDAALRPSGLKITQFTLLVAIAKGAGRASISGLAERLALERTTLVRNLQLLAKDRLIDIGPEGPRRARAITLTTAGRTRLHVALPLWARAQDQLRRRLGPAAWRDLSSHFDQLASLL